MKWNKLSKAESELIYQDFCRKKVADCEDNDKELRKDIINEFNSTLKEIGIKKEQISDKNNAYQVDFRFGIKLYELLNNKYGMTERYAADAGIWRNLSVSVVPEIVTYRYGLDHEDRFWKKAKRLWLRVLWWYIHLSWQGTEKETFNALKDNSTDEILQLVDRCGKGGYRVNLCRCMVSKYSSIYKDIRRKQKLFRRTMVLNTAKVQTIEPALVKGGEKEYVKELYRYFGF